MRPLKRKNLGQRIPGEATTLPTMMQSVTPTMDIYAVPIAELLPAPEGWNFYRPLPPEKFNNLCQSIIDFGLFHPVVVWQKENGEKRILSGHNRVKAYRMLYERTGEEKYTAIPCSVRKELDTEDAYEILIDSNWMQRELTVSERAHSIAEKYRLAGRKPRQTDTSLQGRTYENIASDYGLSGRQVHRYLQIHALSPALLACIDQKQLSMQAGLHIAALPEDTREAIGAAEALPLLTNARVKAIPEKASPAQALAILHQEKNPEGNEDDKSILIQVRIPISKHAAFLEMARKWCNQNGFTL